MEPIPMALGPYMVHSTNWAEIEVVGRPNVAQWTGGQSEKLTIAELSFPKNSAGPQP